MEKKFALLTAQMKSEKRFSRRMEYRRSITVAAAQQLHQNGGGDPSSSTAKQDPLLHSCMSATASFPAPHHHGIYGYHGANRHALPVGYRRSLGHHHHPSSGLVVDGGVLRGGQVASSGTRVPIVVQRHSASCRYRDRSRGGQSSDEIIPLQSNQQSISVIDSNSQPAPPLTSASEIDAETAADSSNMTNVHLLSVASGPSLQSFPLDETCVYNNQHPHTSGSKPTIPNSQHIAPISQIGGSSSSTSSSPRATTGQRLQSHRDASPHSGSQHHRQRRGQGTVPPNVPRRTVSRLTSGQAESTAANAAITAAVSHLTSTSPESSSSTIITVSSSAKQQVPHPQPKLSPSASLSSNASANSTHSASSDNFFFYFEIL